MCPWSQEPIEPLVIEQCWRKIHAATAIKGVPLLCHGTDMEGSVTWANETFALDPPLRVINVNMVMQVTCESVACHIRYTSSVRWASHR